jgi:predicted amidohydrolase YtcJ
VPALLLYNADVHTLDRHRPQATALLISEGRIAAIGDDEVRNCLPAQWSGQDCEGDLILPAFVDAHIHLLSYAASLRSVDCSPRAVRDIESLLASVAERARRTPPGRWIRATGYRESELAERRHPTRWDLDRVTPDLPVRLFHGSGHASVLNSAALEWAGITSATETPAPGQMERRLEDGEPNGLFVELEGWLDERLPRTGEEELEQGVLEANRRLLEAGITSVQDMGPRNDRSTMMLLASLRERRILTIDVEAAMGLPCFLGRGRSEPAPALLKLVVTDLGGPLDPPLDELVENVLAGHRAGARVAVHAATAAAVEHAIRGFEAAAECDHLSAARHRIEHASICPPQLARRAAALGLIAVSNPGFLVESGDRFLADVLAADLPYLYDAGGLCDAGVCVAAGSDAPQSTPDPLRSIRGAVTRRTAQGQVVPGRPMDGQAALVAHTSAAAFAGRQEQMHGTLASGRAADLVRITAGYEDLLAGAVAAVADTMLAGAWQRGRV